MPGAIGWAPALLPSRGGVIAHPKVQSRNSDSARCDWEIEEVAEAALLPVAPTLRSGKLDRPVKYKFFRRSNILAIRVQQQRETRMFRCLLWALAAAVQPKALLIADNLCLRQQLLVLQRRMPRPRLEDADRRFWILVCRWFSGWRTSLLIVKPPTVVGG